MITEEEVLGLPKPTCKRKKNLHPDLSIENYSLSKEDLTTILTVQ